MIAKPNSIRRWRERGGIVAGCLIALGVLLLIGIIGGIWLSQNWRWVVANPFRAALVQGIEESRIPEDQQKQMIAEIDQLTEDFKSGKLSMQQLSRVFEEIGESPLLPVGTVYFIDEQYFAKSGLTEEEKQAGRLHLNRYARGIYEEDIARNDVERVVDPIADTSGDSIQFRPPEQVTDDELREMIRRAEEKADQVGVPEEMWEINFAEEFSAAIDRALGRAPAEPKGAGGTEDAAEPEPPAEPAKEGGESPPAQEPAEPEPEPAGGG